MMKASNPNYQRGAAALFAVIFSTILLSIITISFVTMMLKDQRRAIDDDLSQGAYDAALAGVEDAKRVVVRAKRGDLAAANAITNQRCTTVQDSNALGAGVDPKEVLVKSTSSASGQSEFNQAYTCVKVDLDSPDYLGRIAANSSAMIPLHPTGNVKTIQIEWHKNEDGSLQNWNDTSPAALQLSRTEWSGPSLMRAQLMTPGGAIQLAQLDNVGSSGTVFMYPKPLNSGTIAEFSQAALHRYAPATDDTTWYFTGPGRVASCQKDSLSYACVVRITLKDEIPAGNQLSFLRLTSLYRSSSVRVVMFDTENKVVKFNGVQPIADSQGRANDIFRRVQARLSFEGVFNYPNYAVDTNGSFCKNFYVTKDGSGRAGRYGCTP